MVVGNVSLNNQTYKFPPNSFYFDGTGYIFVPTSYIAFLTDNFTVEMWVNATSFASTPILVDFRPENTNGNYFTLYINSSGQPIFYNNGAVRITGTALSINKWYHIAVCRTNSNTKIFIDGVQSGSTYSDTTSYISTLASPIIGGNGNTLGLNLYTGYIDDLRITVAGRYPTSFDVSLVGNDSPGWNQNSQCIVVPNDFICLEGNDIVFTIKTVNVLNGTVLYWSSYGTATKDRFTDFDDSGTITIVDNVGTVVRPTYWNNIDDNSSTIGIKVFNSDNVLLGDSGLVEIVDKQFPMLEYLIVAGGGGGGVGGGGGAGGVLYKSNAIFNSGQTYNVIVGAGGIGTIYSTNGTNSSIIGKNKNLIAVGGGAGATLDLNQPGAGPSGSGWRGANGGSGGGGGGNSTGSAGANIGGSGIPFQGCDGGTAPGANGTPSCGGGGAGAPAASGGVTPGGIGLSDSQVGGILSAANVGVEVSGVRYIAGGGGGGSYNVGAAVGGLGGGGNGAGAGGISTAGLDNTGGGGGGRSTGDGGSAGGSGIVVVKCATTTITSVTGDPQIVNGDNYIAYIWTGSGSFTI